ncbi:MAG: RnfABCDGE type electron transport complex subunit G [Kiritimatiellia bacterium]
MKILSLVLPLTLIAGICAAVLAVVNAVTKGPIANIASLKANAAARAVLPAGTKAIDTRTDPADGAVRIFVGYADDDKRTIAGYAVPGVSGNGYGGDIRLMVGLTPARTVVSYQVLAANETPGLGAKLGDRTFSAQFEGRAATGLKVKKDGGEIDAITGATITSRAVCGAIADACARVDRLEGKASAAAPARSVANKGRLILDPAKPETALKVLPRGTTTAMPLAGSGRFPIFEGRDAAGRTTGYAVVGTGTGKGPDGEIVIHYLYGLTPDGQISRTARSLPVNQLDISTADMITAQMTAINAAMQDALAKLKASRAK